MTTNATWTHANGDKSRVWADGGCIWQSRDLATPHDLHLATYEATEWADDDTETAWQVEYLGRLDGTLAHD